MTKNVQRFLLGLAALFVVSVKADAQTTLIHYWDFNNLPSDFSVYTPDITPLHANYSVIDTNTATIDYAIMPGVSSTYDSTFWDVYVASDTTGESFNLMAGDTIGNSLRVRNPSDSMQLLLNIPTTGFQNIMVMYTCEASNNGMKTQLYDYSTDGGSTWKTDAISMTVDSPLAITWSPFMITFNDALDTAVKNNGSLVLRIRFMGATSGTEGNNRFDNFSVSGDTLVVPVDTTGTDTSTTAVKNIAAVSNGYSLMPNPASNIIYINAPDAADNRTIYIYNAIGQKVYTGTQLGSKAAVNVSQLSAGTYYINIKDASGRISDLKFVKQ